MYSTSIFGCQAHKVSTNVKCTQIHDSKDTDIHPTQKEEEPQSQFLVDRRSRGLPIHVTVMDETRIQGTSLLTLLIHVSYIDSTVNHWKPAYTGCSAWPSFLQKD